MKKFAFFDIDKTLHNGYSAVQFLAFLNNKGIIGPEPSEYMERLRHEYEELKLRNYHETAVLGMENTGKALAGLKVEDIEKFSDEFARDIKFFDWTEGVINYLANHNFRIIFLSASIAPPLKGILNRLPLGDYELHTTVSEVKNGFYTGKLLKVFHSKEKGELAQKILENEKPNFTISAGDSDGDLDMLELTDLTFVINPKDKLLIKKAKQNDWIFPQTAKDFIEPIEGKLSEIV